MEGLTSVALRIQFTITFMEQVRQTTNYPRTTSIKIIIKVARSLPLSAKVKTSKAPVSLFLAKASGSKPVAKAQEPPTTPKSGQPSCRTRSNQAVSTTSTATGNLINCSLNPSNKRRPFQKRRISYRESIRYFKTREIIINRSI